MTNPSDSSPFPVIETVPLGDHLPQSEKVVYRRNPVIDGVIDFTGGSMGKYSDSIKAKLKIPVFRVT